IVPKKAVCLPEVRDTMIHLPGKGNLVSYSPQGRYLYIKAYAGPHKRFRSNYLWEFKTHKLCPLPDSNQVAFCPFDTCLALDHWDGDILTMRILDVRTGRIVSKITEKGDYRGKVFSPDGTTLAWDTGEGQSRNGERGIYLWRYRTHVRRFLSH